MGLRPTEVLLNLVSNFSSKCEFSSTTRQGSFVFPHTALAYHRAIFWAHKIFHPWHWWFYPLATCRFEPVTISAFLTNDALCSNRFASQARPWRALVFIEWNSIVGFTQLLWYSFYSSHSFLIYVLLGNYQLVPAHSVSFRVLQIGQNHFSSHIFINFCLIPQSFALIAMCDVEFSGMNEILLAHCIELTIFFLQGWNLLNMLS